MRVWCLALVWIGLAAPAGPAAGQSGSIAGQPQPTGTARLTGRVVARDNGRPAGRVVVSVSGLPAASAGGVRVHIARKVETGDDGRFAIEGLPAGSYSIRVEPANLFVRPAAAKEATLADGATAEVTFRLERTGAIAGRVTDEHGNGVVGAQVHALRRSAFESFLTSTRGSVGTTDDRGRYRLYNLPPGEYQVLATHNPPWVSRDFDSRSRAGLAETWHRRAARLEDARAVRVRAGKDKSGVDVTLAACRLARMTIHAVDSRGVRLGRHAYVSLSRNDGVHLVHQPHQLIRPEDGTFVFHDVTPGNYVLVVASSHALEEGAYRRVAIDGTDLALTVQTNTGAKVSGRVVVEGTRAGGTGREATIAATPPPRTYGVQYAAVPLARSAAGRFEMSGLRGPMVLRAEVSGGALVSIRRGDEEVAGKTLQFTGTEIIDDLVVTLTTDVAKVDVTVTGRTAPDDPEPVMVVLFSEDPARWRQGFLQYAQTTASRSTPATSDPRSAAQGPGARRLHLGRMVPGRYLVVAYADRDGSSATDPRVLERLRPLAVPVTLVAGETPNVTVKVADAPR